MRFRTFRQIRVLAVSLTTAAAATTLFAIAATATPASAASSSACPASKTLASLPTATNVAASFSSSGSTTTYMFLSLKNENSVNGIPGLIKYCVYTSPLPKTIVPTAVGADGSKWTKATGSNNFAFVRPGGDKTNIPLDGKSTTMGTADWGNGNSAPADQTIILHINDPTVCASLFPGSTSATCFVKPSPAGPVCNAGDSTVAYNAMPLGVENCVNPALGFEAQNVNEFGDEVGLAGTARSLVSLKVLFASYACQSGHWNTGDCVSADGATFDVPITATLYAANDSTSPPSVGAQLAQVTVTQTIPYRPSADSTCPAGSGAPAGARWFNPLAPGGGQCQNNIGKVLTFTFPAGTTLPDHVIWTVAFNTSTSGYSPLGTGNPCNTSAGGCPYDSLNVGTKSYPNAPYAGVDISEDQAFMSSGGSNAPLVVSTGWTGFRPLGEIITTP